MASSETTSSIDLDLKKDMPNVLIFKGFPAVGKTFTAKQIIGSNINKWTRVNKDDLRAMMNDSHFSKPNEALVIKVRDAIILEAIKAGRNVIVDDTNLNPVHERQIKGLVFGLAHVSVVMFDQSLEVALKNNEERTDLLATGEPHKVPAQAIKGMHKDWTQRWSKKIVPDMIMDRSKFILNPDLPPCTICDIDGTLAIMGKRSPFDWKRVGVDSVNYLVRNYLDWCYLNGANILLSGRDEVCRPETEEWLEEYEVGYDKLYMRPKGDGRKDSVVKYELLVEKVLPEYYPTLVLDDRNQVVRMWRSLGIPTWQVNDGDF